MIRSVVLCMALAASACTSAGETPVSQPDPVVTAAPTAEPTASPVPTPSATPAPTPVQIMEQAVCPETRENAGLEYDFAPRQFSEARAEDHFCGERTLFTRTCPSNRSKAGSVYTYSPSEHSTAAADAINCGAKVQKSAWTTGEEVDRLTGSRFVVAVNDSSDHNVDLTFTDDPRLLVGCVLSDNGSDLLVTMWFGNAPVSGFGNSVVGFRVDVAYRFDNEPLVEQEWDHDISGRIYVLPKDKIQKFVSSLERGRELVFRVWQNRLGEKTYTATFDLTGVDRDVEPVLQECGY